MNSHFFCRTFACGIWTVALLLLSTPSVASSPLVFSAHQVIDNSQILFYPIALAAPHSDSEYLYVAHRSHLRIAVYDRETGARESQLFFDADPNVMGNQEGLLSFTFHPDYANNGLFYTYIYSNDDRKGVISEHRVSESDPLAADPNYERVIYEISNENSHNGGWIGFGPHDGYLYFTTGDGGVNQGADSGLPAQDPFDPHGKVLRFDIAGDDFPDDANANYAIPPTNPFAVSGGAPEVYALGLRHPFRAGFDSLTGDLYIGDVGGANFEEIDVLSADSGGGENFGWRPYEGNLLLHPNDPAPIDPVFPIHTYPRSGGAAVIGGSVYRGSESPALQGTYLFGDFVKKTIGSLIYDGTAASDVQDRTDELFPSGTSSLGGITAFGEDGLGEVYVVTLGSGVFRIEAGLKGDYNGDNVVDLGDYTVWRDSLGAPGTTLMNRDPDNTGVVGAGDYDTWKMFFGNTAADLVAAQSLAVPEPCSAAIAGLAAVAVVLSFRRHR